MNWMIARCLMAMRVQMVFVLLAGFLAVAPAAHGQALPGNSNDLAFDAFVKSLDLEDPGFDFLYKTGKHDGSSIGFHVAEQGQRKIGTFAPYNSSSDPEAEVVTYRLARFLEVSDIYNPVTYYEIGPRASSRFKVMLKKHSESDPDRLANRTRIMAQFAEKPDRMFGIYRYRMKGNKYTVTVLGTEGQLNTGHPLATFIRANGPLPSSNTMSLPGVKGQRSEYPKPIETELELARQLSIIMVVDQLTGQWDRFWRNLEAVSDRDGRLRLLSRDNGGANLDDGWEWHPLYERWVSRYDREMVSKLTMLNAFLQERQTRLGDFADVETWRTTIGFRKTSSFNTFKRKLAMLIDAKLPALERQYGNKMFFAAPQPVATKGDMPTIKTR